MLLVVVGALSLAADRPSSGVVEALVAPQHPRIAFGAAKKPVAGVDARRSLSASSPAFSAVVPEAVRVADGCAETSSLTTTTTTSPPLLSTPKRAGSSMSKLPGIGSALGATVKKKAGAARNAGASFALSYSILSQINGSVSLSVAWYLSSTATGMSPLAPGQWKSLLAAYGKLCAFVQLMRPVRIVAAIAMSKVSGEFLAATQRRFRCSRASAAAVQYAVGWVAWLACTTAGVAVASHAAGVPVF